MPNRVQIRVVFELIVIDPLHFLPLRSSLPNRLLQLRSGSLPRLPSGRIHVLLRLNFRLILIVRLDVGHGDPGQELAVAQRREVDCLELRRYEVVQCLGVDIFRRLERRKVLPHRVGDQHLIQRAHCGVLLAGGVRLAGAGPGLGARVLELLLERPELHLLLRSLRLDGRDLGAGAGEGRLGCGLPLASRLQPRFEACEQILKLLEVLPRETGTR
mmetsp:Transcript_35984/g.85165  ORF Transcript_35984/g.85165 Transcript_35984/m.85165 type:complete len:215 (-) Transcript_35984:133-777(-)